MIQSTEAGKATNRACELLLARLHIVQGASIVLLSGVCRRLSSSVTLHGGPAGTPLWTRTTVADGHKFSALRRLSRRLLDRSKHAMLSIPRAFGAPVEGDPIEIS